MTASAIYEGTIAHRRTEPIEHAFSYRVCMLYLDLDELPRVLDSHPLWSARRAAPGRFRRADYVGDPSVSLLVAVRDEVRRLRGRPPAGPIRLLSTPRTFGRAFNPVSFYFCFEADGTTVDTVLAEVTNTPWGERHTYLMDPEGGGAEKAFHVSPFMGMDHTYSWRLTEPGASVRVSIRSDREGRRVFDAGLTLERRPLDRSGLSHVLARYPLATLATLARIYGQAIRLKFKGAPYHPHPRASATGEPA